MPADAETFNGMVAAIKREVPRSDSESEEQIRHCIARQLQTLRFERFPFTSASAELDLVVDQEAYVRSIVAASRTSLPADALAVDSVHLATGRKGFLRRVTNGEYRRLQGATFVLGSPSCWTWFSAAEPYLAVWPIPSSADTLLLDYHQDSTYSDGGVEITPDSTSDTNIWFKRRGGEALLRCLAVADLAMTYLGDEALASRYATMAGQRKAEFQREYVMAQLQGGTPVPAWGIE